jgi:hypothetical protein
MVRGMRYEFLSDEWFDKVEQMVAAAGDLQIPTAMKSVAVNVTITGTGAGERKLFMKDGLFGRGHQAAPTTLTLDAVLARKIFIDADAAAGVQAFLEGQIQVDGDLAQLVAMQTVEPSEPQKQLTREIAAVTA